MNLIRELRELGQSLWRDNITREMLDDGRLGKLIEDFSIIGLTSNPSIFNQAMGASAAYDGAIRDKASAGKSGEALFMELALEDLCRAAELFRPVHISTDHLLTLFALSHLWMARRRLVALTGEVPASCGNG